MRIMYHIENVMNVDILSEFKDIFLIKKNFQQVVKFLISLEYHGRSNYLLLHPLRKKKKAN